MTPTEPRKASKPETINRIAQDKGDAAVENFKRNIRSFIDEMRAKNRRVTWIARESNIHRQTLDRWRKEGLRGISDEFELFCSKWGIDPESMWKAKYRREEAQPASGNRFAEIQSLLTRFIGRDPTDNELAYMTETLRRAIR